MKMLEKGMLSIGNIGSHDENARKGYACNIGSHNENARKGYASIDIIGSHDENVRKRYTFKRISLSFLHSLIRIM